MESTGVYWIVPYEILEEAGFEVLLVNPKFFKSALGRKTDVQDCQWIHIAPFLRSFEKDPFAHHLSRL